MHFSDGRDWKGKGKMTKAIEKTLAENRKRVWLNIRRLRKNCVFFTVGRFCWERKITNTLCSSYIDTCILRIIRWHSWNKRLMLRLLWYFCQLCRCVLIVASTCMTPFFLVCLRKFLHHSRNCFLTSVDWLRIRSRRMKLDARPARSREIYKRLSKKRPTDSSSSPFCVLLSSFPPFRNASFLFFNWKKAWNAGPALLRPRLHPARDLRKILVFFDWENMHSKKNTFEHK